MKQIINFLKCHKLASIAILCVLIAAVTLCILLNQNKKTNTKRLEIRKYCPKCGKHTLHKETKWEDMAKEKIAEREIERLKKDYGIEDRELFDKIKKGAVTQSNAREIKHLIKDTFSLVVLKKICGETEI